MELSFLYMSLFHFFFNTFFTHTPFPLAQREHQLMETKLA